MSIFEILQYHVISKKFFPSGGFVPQRLFESHLRYLSKYGFRSPSLEEIFALPSRPSGKVVLITFDDCASDLMDYAVPALLKWRFNAIFFIVAGFIGKMNIWDPFFIGRYRHLDGRMLRELRKLGFFVGSHSLYHHDLTRIDMATLRREIIDSKKLIEDIIGEDVLFFSYPYGRFNERVIEMVVEAGYKLAFASSTAPLSNPYAIRRRGVYIVDFYIGSKFQNSFPYTLELRKEQLIQIFSNLSGLVKHKMPNLSKIIGMLSFKSEPSNENSSSN